MLDLYDAIANEEVPYPRHVAVSGARCIVAAHATQHRCPLPPPRPRALTGWVLLGTLQTSCRTFSFASCTATQRSA